MEDKLEQNTAEDEQYTEPDDQEDYEEPEGPGLLTRLAKSFVAWYKKRLRRNIVATLLILIFIAALWPTSRYFLAGFVAKRDFQIQVVDSATQIPVSGVEVSLGGKTTKTDGEGLATIERARAGKAKVSLKKNYYSDKTGEVLVPIGRQKDVWQVAFEATGRQVPVYVVNKITGQALSGASISVLDTETITDKNGEAVLVLPATQPKVEASLELTGYNNQKVEVTVSSQAVAANTFGMTPFGKVYFLSKKDGAIGVYQANLDGTDSKQVVKGTGFEDDADTLLIPSYDWKYLVLKARRDSGSAKLYAFDTEKSELNEVDGGDGDITIVGWVGNNFVYRLEKPDKPMWQGERSFIKSYSADISKVNTIDQAAAEGNTQEFAAETFGPVFVSGNRVIYPKYWTASYQGVYRLAEKRMGIFSANPNGSEKQSLKDFAAGNNGFITSTKVKPDEIYFKINSANKDFLVYQSLSLEPSGRINDQHLNKIYPVYLPSPSGDKTLWFEKRDGQNVLLTGNRNGLAPTILGNYGGLMPYGWFSDNYLLAVKDGELFILSVEGLKRGGQILKVSDYHKSQTKYFGYGSS